MASKKIPTTLMRTEMSPHNYDKRLCSEPSPNRLLKGMESRNSKQQINCNVKKGSPKSDFIQLKKPTATLKTQVVKVNNMERSNSRNQLNYQTIQSNTQPLQGQSLVGQILKFQSSQQEKLQEKINNAVNFIQSKKPEYKKISINLQKEPTEEKENKPLTTRSPPNELIIPQAQMIYLKEENIKKLSGELQNEMKQIQQSKNFYKKCYKHSEKKAKYEVEHKEVCSGCAIEFAMKQGVDIQKLQQIEKKLLTFGQDDETEFYDFIQLEKEIKKLQQIQLSGEPSLKKQKVECFLRSLSTVIKDSLDLQNLLKSGQKLNSRNIQQVLNELSGIVEEIFKQCVTSVQPNNLIQFSEPLAKYIKDTQSIKRDILDNLENIVQSMEIDPFNMILSKYADKVQNIEENLQQMRKKLLTSVNFDKLKSSEFKEKLENLVGLYMRSQNETCFSFENRNDFPKVPLSPKSVKYVELLHKVNQNQSNNSMFYQTLINRDKLNEVASTPQLRANRYNLLEIQHLSPHFN